MADHLTLSHIVLHVSKLSLPFFLSLSPLLLFMLGFYLFAITHQMLDIESKIRVLQLTQCHVSVMLDLKDFSLGWLLSKLLFLLPFLWCLQSPIETLLYIALTYIVYFFFSKQVHSLAHKSSIAQYKARI